MYVYSAVLRLHAEGVKETSPGWSAAEPWVEYKKGSALKELKKATTLRWAFACKPILCRSDIILAVIHRRAKRPRRHTARRSELVNNCAASHNDAGGRPALARSRSLPLHPRRVTVRLPAEPVALALTSNRKTPPEGH
jgi:hypothetical protein